MTASGLALPSPSSCDTARVPAAKKIVTTYDTRNRRGTTTYGDGSPIVGRTYWADGLPMAVVSNGSVWTSTYNRRRLIESENLGYGGVNYNIVRSYDANGSLAQLKYPIDGLAIDYLPNALGEPRKIGAYASAITYYPNGAINTFTYGNGITHTSQQNTRQLPVLNNDTGVTNDAYTYDADASLLSITDNQRNLNSRAMGYDDLGRLITVSAPQSWGTATYQYDGIDNLTSSTITGGAAARTLTHNIDGNNRLGSITGGPEPFTVSYSYDSQGNIATRRDLFYTFDIANRLTAVPGRATYLYDGLGHRFSSVTGTTNVLQVYTQAGQLLQTGPSGTTGTRYIYLHNHVLAEVAGASVIYDHTDALGSPVAQTSSTGAVINTTTYEPYGYVSAGTKHNIGFTGHVNDTETGMIYMQQRYYDPIAGRMLSIDPVITDANTGGSFNRYAYARNSPYKYIDPDGRFSDESNAKTCGFMVGNCSGGTANVAAGVNGARNFLDGGYGARAGAAFTNGDLGSGVGYTVAGALYGAMNFVTFGEAGAIAGTTRAVAWTITAKSAGALGREGEAAVRAVYDIGEKPMQSILMNGRARIPDGINPLGKSLSEVKNVNSLSFTSQLRDYSIYAQGQGLRFDLYTRSSTQLSGPLQDAIDSGLINHLHIP